MNFHSLLEVALKNKKKADKDVKQIKLHQAKRLQDAQKRVINDAAVKEYLIKKKLQEATKQEEKLRLKQVEKARKKQEKNEREESSRLAQEEADKQAAQAAAKHRQFMAKVSGDAHLSSSSTSNSTKSTTTYSSLSTKSVKPSKVPSTMNFTEMMELAKKNAKSDAGSSSGSSSSDDSEKMRQSKVGTKSRISVDPKKLSHSQYKPSSNANAISSKVSDKQKHSGLPSTHCKDSAQINSQKSDSLTQNRLPQKLANKSQTSGITSQNNIFFKSGATVQNNSFKKSEYKVHSNSAQNFGIKAQSNPSQLTGIKVQSDMSKNLGINAQTSGIKTLSNVPLNSGIKPQNVSGNKIPIQNSGIKSQNSFSQNSGGIKTVNGFTRKSETITQSNKPGILAQNSTYPKPGILAQSGVSLQQPSIKSSKRDDQPSSKSKPTTGSGEVYQKPETTRKTSSASSIGSKAVGKSSAPAAVKHKLASSQRDDFKKPRMSLPQSNEPKRGGIFAQNTNPVLLSGIRAQTGFSKPRIDDAYSDEEEDEYDAELDDFIDDSEVVTDKDYLSCVKSIHSSLHFDPNKYAKVRPSDNLRDMESNFTQVEREEKRSARMGRKEDADDILKEEEEKKRKMQKKQKKREN